LDTFHDGTSPEDQAVDYAVSQGATVFIAAGNEAGDGCHYSGTVPPFGSTGFIGVNIGPSATALQYNLVWYDGIGIHTYLFH